MTTQAKQPRALTRVTSAVKDDIVLLQTKVLEDSNTRVVGISVGNLLANTSGGFSQTMSTPANSTANCVVGQLWFDTNYMYFAVANNTIKRVILESF